MERRGNYFVIIHKHTSSIHDNRRSQQSIQFDPKVLRTIADGCYKPTNTTSSRLAPDKREHFIHVNTFMWAELRPRRRPTRGDLETTKQPDLRIEAIHRCFVDEGNSIQFWVFSWRALASKAAKQLTSLLVT